MNIKDAYESIRDAANQQWHSVRGQSPDSSTLLALVRPELPPELQRWRRALEPILAAVCLTALATLFSIAGVSLMTFMVAAALMYLIVTQVFGIELDLDPSAFRV